MWLIIKIKKDCIIKNLKANLQKMLSSEAKLYSPKIFRQIVKGNKLYNKDYYVLGNYLLVFHDKFNNDQISNKLNFLKGVEFVFKGFKLYQEEISKFIARCRSNEDENGYLIQDFFTLELGNRLKFNSGPFVNFISELIGVQKKNISVLAGRYKILINKKKNCLSSC